MYLGVHFRYRYLKTILVFAPYHFMHTPPVKVTERILILIWPQQSTLPPQPLAPSPSLGVRAGRSHNAVLPQKVPQGLVLGLPVFHLSTSNNAEQDPSPLDWGFSVSQSDGHGWPRTSCRRSWLSILRRSSVPMSSPSLTLLCLSSLM